MRKAADCKTPQRKRNGRGEEAAPTMCAPTLGHSSDAEQEYSGQTRMNCK